ncbi:unnamed protein product [Lasius platythorax]|uniref:HAT C-terminal dimerisation domain-containing protein n=1 Tax=Lasius platythorax TaxID=488582 RepID=A0AAV2P2R2_9HYME
MSNTSELMKHFKKIDNSTMSCNLCDKHIKTSGNSSLATMANHINSHSNKNRLNSNKINNNASHTLETPTKSMRLKRSQLTQMNMSSAAAAPARMSSYSNDEDAKILNAILYYMCIDDKPFNTIHCKGFKYLMKELAPNYKIPSEKTIERRLDEKYDVIVKNFKQQLNETLYVTIGIDTWSEAVPCKSFLLVTVHFIASATKKLESGTIELIELSEYTVDYITSALRNTLNKWGISKVATVVINTESNIVFKTVAQFFNPTQCIICFVHIIDLVAENSMKNCEGLSDIIDKVRLTVKFIKDSTDINNELHQRQVNLGKTEIKKLILDIDFIVRWNITFHMIERFIELWTVINVLLINHKTPDIKVPTDDELNMLKEIVVLLRPLACMAEECSAENYIIISKIIPLINCALIEYKKTTQTMELSMKLKETILKELQSIFGQIQSIDSISIATILDPRFKTIHFQNTQTLANIMYQLRGCINNSNQNELSSVSSSHESNTEQDKTKYNLWNHHKFLAHEHKDELTLYLAMPISSFNDDPFEKWESMKIQFPSLYKITRRYLSIVATPVPAKRLFSKTRKMIQSEDQLTVERLNKLSFLNSVDKRYWSQ